MTCVSLRCLRRLRGLLDVLEGRGPIIKSYTTTSKRKEVLGQLGRAFDRVKRELDPKLHIIIS
jgi:hypothetical protein